MKKTNILLLSCLLILFLAAMTAQTPNPQPVNSPSQNSQVYVDVLLPEYDHEALKRESDLIVTGTIINSGKSLLIERTDGAKETYTDYRFEIKEVLKGKTQNKELVIRVLGGKTQFGEVISTSLSLPMFEKNSPYLLFLYQPKMGGGSNTRGDYYYVLGQGQGVYTLDKDSRHSLTSYRGQMEPDTSLNVHELKEDLKNNSLRYQHSPDDYRKRTLANLRANLDSGFLTEEEYQQTLDQLNQYARIVHEEPLE